MTNEKSLITDETDKKIISLLFEDARKNFSEIGETVGLSKNAVWTHYKNMCKKAIITGATVQINYKKLGYDAVAQLLLLVDPSKVEEVISYIKAKIPDVFGPALSASRYNVRAIVALKTIGELGDLKEDLRRKLPIAEVQSMIWTDVWFTPQNLTQFSIKQDIRSKNNIVNGKIFCADKTDLELIGHLAVNSRQSFRTIANEMGLSTDTLARRYKKLREKGVIIPRIQIDPAKVGYPGFLHYFLRINPEQDIEKIITKILSIPDVVYLMKCTGDYQISVMTAIRDLKQVIETGVLISKIEGLRLLETTINPSMAKWPVSRAYSST
jgi:DNA-binding Lrp family transcriptional regulator